jgi:hypothetical protein
MRGAIDTALSNIIGFGDTDVFPYPVENHVFFDTRTETIALLEDIDARFADYLIANPVAQERGLAAIGYYGFRWGTLIDPIWNAYLLSLLVHVGPDIEQARVGRERQVVFSYRFNPDPAIGTVFDPAIGWSQFQERAIELAKASEFVLECDISDFYPRVYHHRIENALRRATTDSTAVDRIMALLKQMSKGVSYGLPVGGPAARLLSELLLNRVDRLLLAQGITFCRFADDYRLFAVSREDAYRQLIFLTEKLFENEGLALQKSKTLIMSSEEFLSTRMLIVDDSLEPEENEERSFLLLRLHYDPYAPTADADYEALQAELRRYDILGMLMRQMNKSRIDQQLTKRLIRAVRFLSPELRDRASLSLIENLDVLFPVIPTTMMLYRSIWTELSADACNAVVSVIRQRIRERSYIFQIPVNLGFALRVLAYDASDETDEVLAQIYTESGSPSLWQ